MRISEKTIRSYKDGKSMPDRTNIIKMAFALRLSSNYICHMLKQADLSITREYGEMFGDDLQMDFDKFNPLDKMQGENKRIKMR